MTAANHTPTSILALARAAFGQAHHDPEYEAMSGACSPALIIALVERLRLASAAVPDYSPDFPAAAEYMNTPLLPAPELEKPR